MQSYLDGTPTDGETAKERDWAGGVGKARKMDHLGAGGVAFLGKRGEITDWLI